MREKSVTFTDLSRRPGRKLYLVAAAALVLIASGAKAETQRAKGDKLLVAPIQSDSGSNTPKESKARNSRPLTRDKGIPADIWTTPPQVVPYTESYWSPLGIDVGAGADGNVRPKKFGYAPPVPGSTNAFDKLKIGESYLGVDTQRRLQTRVPSGKVDCATDEECEDYSPMPKSRSRGSTSGINSPSMFHARKPFFGLSITTPIE